MLRSFGNVVEIAHDGKEAIQRLIEIDPDVKAIVSSGYPMTR